MKTELALVNIFEYHYILQDESSYFTALSEYLITCMIFVLFAMMYFGIMALIVNIKLWQIVKKKKLQQQQDQEVSPSTGSFEISDQEKKDRPLGINLIFSKDVGKLNEQFQQELYMNWDHRIFLTYNLVFSIYNIFYFSNHMS